MTATGCYVHANTDPETGACLDCGASAPAVIAAYKQHVADLTKSRVEAHSLLIGDIESRDAQIAIAVEALAWYAGMGSERADVALKRMRDMAQRKGDTK